MAGLLGDLVMFSTPANIFLTKSVMVLATFLKKYSLTTTNGMLLSMVSMDDIASKDAGVMEI